MRIHIDWTTPAMIGPVLIDGTSADLSGSIRNCWTWPGHPTKQYAVTVTASIPSRPCGQAQVRRPRLPKTGQVYSDIHQQNAVREVHAAGMEEHKFAMAARKVTIALLLLACCGDLLACAPAGSDFLGPDSWAPYLTAPSAEADQLLFRWQYLTPVEPEKYFDWPRPPESTDHMHRAATVHGHAVTDCIMHSRLR